MVTAKWRLQKRPQEVNHPVVYMTLIIFKREPKPMTPSRRIKLFSYYFDDKKYKNVETSWSNGCFNIYFASNVWNGVMTKYFSQRRINNNPQPHALLAIYLAYCVKKHESFLDFRNKELLGLCRQVALIHLPIRWKNLSSLASQLVQLKCQPRRVLDCFSKCILTRSVGLKFRTSLALNMGVELVRHFDC